MISENELLENFLERNRIELDVYNSANISWEDLLKIGLKHQENFSLLADTAAFLSKVLQQGVGVHSVRWRVKDAEHLMEKIVRKKADGSDKYRDISDENYSEKITDLVGVRVLHLFKEDWEHIHDYITSKWSTQEKPTAYIRPGDQLENNLFEDKGCEVKEHSAGYRSIHYIISTRPMNQDIYSEIQVRTIFEKAGVK